MKKLILLLALYGVFFGINTMKAQDADTKKSFLTMGVSINIPKEHSITVYGGVSTSPEHTQIAMVMPNIKINKYISFMPLYVFLKSPQAHSKRSERAPNQCDADFLPSSGQTKQMDSAKPKHLFA